jgi:hypothetical protein
MPDNRDGTFTAMDQGTNEAMLFGLIRRLFPLCGHSNNQTCRLCVGSRVDASCIFGTVAQLLVRRGGIEQRLAQVNINIDMSVHVFSFRNRPKRKKKTAYLSQDPMCDLPRRFA